MAQAHLRRRRRAGQSRLHAFGTDQTLRLVSAHKSDEALSGAEVLGSGGNRRGTDNDVLRLGREGSDEVRASSRFGSGLPLPVPLARAGADADRGKIVTRVTRQPAPGLRR